MAKKKKTQLKPVARGFATTSVPKKVAPVEEEPVPEAQPYLGDEPSQAQDSSQSKIVVPQIDPEQEYLQTYVDKFQDRTEREINRTIKAIEQDRRFAQTLPPLQLDSKFVERILCLVTETELQPGTLRFLFQSEPPVEVPLLALHTVDEPESKALPKLAITYGTLRRLGFPEDDVYQCLESVSGLELDDAIDWLHVHCDEELLRRIDPDAKPSEGEGSKVSQRPASPSFSTATSVSATLSPSWPSTPVPNTLDLFAKPFILSVQSAYSRGFDEDEDHSHKSAQDYADDPTTAFVQVKMRIADLTTHRQLGEVADASDLRELKRRLEAIKDDYLFDEAEADMAYLVERKKADAASLQARLRGEESIVSPPLVRTPIQKPAELQIATPLPHEEPQPPASDDFFAGDDDDAPGGLFELLEAMPTTEATPQGTTIVVRDLSFPKQWSGRTPKTLLQETVRKSDKYAAMEYRSISGPSRVKRANLSIRWDGGKLEEWSMEDVGCHDTIQAEQYVATVALHALSFPRLEGFALGVPTASTQTTSFRLLPPVFRDLWDELEAKRRQSTDSINREIWSKLKTILEPKLVIGSKMTNATLKDSGPQTHRPSRKPRVDSLESAHIMADFQARQERPAYQDMLYRRNDLPIAKYRHEIINTLETSQILVLSGETGWQVNRSLLVMTG
ncbi:hypothetical protein EUX98_g2176 [Antrodiella citrinella]|uniref:UBA domain-containing protein n=1 Tax=Antrodiella citrinella TaxID=2447956 RepID=A0A4S4N2G6_9APHY|nr:hypothetical protein EUX98_g2176 [Antrodiella citrinella]